MEEPKIEINDEKIFEDGKMIKYYFRKRQVIDYGICLISLIACYGALMIVKKNYTLRKKYFFFLKGG